MTISVAALRPFLIACSVALLASCASQPPVRSDYDSAVDFGAYQTFGWIGDSALIASRESDTPVSALNVRRIEEAISRELEAKGYRQADSDASADFVVSFTVGARDRIDVDAFPVPYRGRWWGTWPSYSTSVRDYEEGHLGIDIFDGQSKAPVWYGSLSRSITAADRRDPQAAIDEAVRQILATFPPG